MCTAIMYKNTDTYFGRNLDLERGYGECVVVTPRKYKIEFRSMPSATSHYALIGMAAVFNSYPLYFEATNEKGLSMAGLNFPDNAVYHPFAKNKDNIAPFEFIPWILCNCSSVSEAENMLDKINLTDTCFSSELPLSPLHWMISDTNHSIVVESVATGLNVYDNPFNILTNNPAFDFHKTNLCNYMGLTTGPAASQFDDSLPLHNYSLGMGAMGLPGDFSSTSRFVRAFFVKENSIADANEAASVNQFFHILDSVAMPKGCVWTENGYEYTRYGSCCNANKGIYYYKTYDNFEIKSVSMHDVDLNASHLHINL